MAAPASYARRQFPGAAVDTTISVGISNSDTAVDLNSTAGWPDGSYTGGILVELYSVTTGSTTEKVWATARSSSTLTIVRAADGTSATSHAAGTGIRAVAGAVDADEANKAVAELLAPLTEAGQVLVSDGAQSAVALSAKTAGQILVGNGTTLASVAVSGDATLASSGALTIANDAVENAMIADDAVDSAQIADGAVDLAHMSANSVDSDQYVDGSIDTAHLANDAVTGDKIADDAVDSAHIADGAIDLAHMSANSVDSDQYVDGSIDSVHIANDAVDSQHYAAGSIDTEHIGVIPTCSVSHSTTQSVNDLATAALAADTEDWDSGSMHDTSTNNSRITVPVAGIYAVSAEAEFGATNNYVARTVLAYVNGNQIKALGRSDGAGSSSTPGRVGGSSHLKLAANDYVEIYAFQNNTADTARAVQLIYFTLTWAAPAPS